MRLMKFECESCFEENFLPDSNRKRVDVEELEKILEKN